MGSLICFYSKAWFRGCRLPVVMLYCSFETSKWKKFYKKKVFAHP